MNDLNTKALEALRADDNYLGTIGVNYKDEVPQIQVYRVAKFMITDNVNKAEGIVKGAFGVVVSLSRACLLLKLHSGVEAPIRKVCFETSANTCFVVFSCPDWLRLQSRKDPGPHCWKWLGSVARC